VTDAQGRKIHEEERLEIIRHTLYRNLVTEHEERVAQHSH
jgi:hypothetical protein